MNRLWAAACVWLLAASACSSSGGDDIGKGLVGSGGSGGSGTEPVCAPGDQKACDCVGGATKGVQICRDDGSGWQTCEGCGTGSPCGECDGCCKGTQCMPLATEPNDACGGKGQTCAPCNNGYICTQGHCLVDTGKCTAASCPSGCCNGNVCWQPADQYSGSCGKGGEACGKCTYGGTCAAGSCSDSIDPAASFSIRVKAVTVKEKMPNGDAWDSGGGLPDPYVCMGTNTKSGCTAYCDDVTSCSLSGTGAVIGGFAPLVFTGAELGNLKINVGDDDISSNDSMGSTQYPITKLNPGYTYLVGPFDSVISISFELY